MQFSSEQRFWRPALLQGYGFGPVEQTVECVDTRIRARVEAVKQRRAVLYSMRGPYQHRLKGPTRLLEPIAHMGEDPREPWKDNGIVATLKF